MTNKDVLKLILCQYGYDRNIQIETYYGDYGVVGYKVSASNKEGDVYEEENCDGFMFHIWCILNYMKKHEVDFCHDYWSDSLKYIIDDKLRNESIKIRDQRNLEFEKSLKRIEPVTEWANKNNPCPTCTINKKDHWDDVHYNCELNHTMRCDILLKFNEEYSQRLKESNNL